MRKSTIAAFAAALALPFAAAAQTTSGAVGADPKKGEENKISDVHPEGRSLMFGGKKYSVSGSRTEIMIKGKQADRSQLKSGMICKVEPGKGDEAGKIDCK